MMPTGKRWKATRSKPLATLDIKIDGERGDEKDFTVNADVSVFPEPEISDYLKVDYEYEAQEFESALIDERLESIRKDRAEKKES